MSVSPSGSLKNWSMAAVNSSPSSRSNGGISPTATGARLPGSTVTVNSCIAEAACGSVAVTVTVAVPSATAMTVMTEPDIEAVATAVSETVAS